MLKCCEVKLNLCHFEKIKIGDKLSLRDLKKMQRLLISLVCVILKDSEVKRGKIEETKSYNSLKFIHTFKRSFVTKLS